MNAFEHSDSPTAERIAGVVMRRVFRTATLISVLLTLTGAPAAAQQRYALVVAGANGGAEYERQYSQWTRELSAALTGRMKIDTANVRVLADTPVAGASSTADNLRAAVAALRGKMSRDDLLFVVLIGHGTFDGVDAKFNLVGPDIESSEWAALLGSLPGALVLVNTSSASFPFLERMAGPRRIVITATDSLAQRFDTVFPQYFVSALAADAADMDKNGRVSIWEAFAAAAAGVKRHYEQRGQLATERPLLDDNGDGLGREAVGAGSDGSAASRTYLDEPVPGAPPTDEVLLQLLQKRALLEAEADELKVRRTFMPPPEYQKEFERLMIELARVSKEVRQRTKTDD